MGLYDRFQLSNSTRIPEFAGSYLPELRDAQKVLNADYDLSKGYADKTDLASKTAPVLPNDKKIFDGVYGKIQEGLKSITSREDYENMIPQTQKLAQHAALELKPFGDRVKGYQDYVTSLDDKELGLDSFTKQMLITKSLDDDFRKGEGIKRNPVTGMLEGKFTGATAAKYVDLPKKMDEWVKDAVAREGGGEVVNINGDYIVKNGNKTKVLSKGEIAAIASRALATDPMTQAFINQQGELAGWMTGKSASTIYKKLPANDPLKTEIDKLIASGTPLREAVETLSTKAKVNEITTNFIGYGAEKYDRNDRFTTMDVSANPYGLKDYEDKKAKEVNANIVQGPTQNTNPDIQTYDGLKKATAKISEDINKTTELLKTANQDLATATATKDVVQIAKIKTDIQNLENTLESQATTKGQYDRVNEQNLKDATRALYPGQTWKSLQEKVVAPIKAIITGPISAVTLETGANGKATPAGKAVTLTQDQVAEAIKGSPTSGSNISILSDGIGGKLISVQVSVKDEDGKPKNVIVTGSEAQKIIKAQSSYVKQIDNVSKVPREMKAVYDYVDKTYKPLGDIQTEVTIPKGDLSDNIFKIIKRLPAKDVQGILINLDEMKIDWTKPPSIDTYNTSANQIPVTLYNTDGEEIKVNFDTNKSDVRATLGKAFEERGATPELRLLGKDMRTQLPQYVQKRLIRNDYVSKTPKGDKFYIQTDKDENVPVQFLRNASNEYIVADMEGEPIYTTTSISEAGEWIASIEKYSTNLAEYEAKKKAPK